MTNPALLHSKNMNLKRIFVGLMRKKVVKRAISLRNQTFFLHIVELVDLSDETIKEFVV